MKIFVCAVLVLGLVACSKNTTTTTPSPINTLNTGATISLDLAKSLRVVEDGIRSANTAGAASNDTTASVLRLTARINKAGLDADAVLRSQTALTATQKVSITTLLSPLVTAIQTAIDQDAVKISNSATQNQIKTALAAIQLTIKSTLAALGGN